MLVRSSSFLKYFNFNWVKLGMVSLGKVLDLRFIMVRFWRFFGQFWTAEVWILAQCLIWIPAISGNILAIFGPGKSSKIVFSFMEFSMKDALVILVLISDMILVSSSNSIDMNGHLQDFHLLSNFDLWMSKSNLFLAHVLCTGLILSPCCLIDFLDWIKNSMVTFSKYTISFRNELKSLMGLAISTEEILKKLSNYPVYCLELILSQAQEKPNAFVCPLGDRWFESRLNANFFVIFKIYSQARFDRNCSAEYLANFAKYRISKNRWKFVFFASFFLLILVQFWGFFKEFLDHFFYDSYQEAFY